MRWDRAVLVAGSGVVAVVGCGDPVAPPAARTPQTAPPQAYYYTATILPSPAGRLFAVAAAINDTGDIVGFASDSSLVPRPYLWHLGAPGQLPLGKLYTRGEAHSINGYGTVAGWVGGTAPHAVYWLTASSTPQALGLLGTSSWGNDINLSGAIVGGYATTGGTQAFVYDAAYQMRALPLPAGSSQGEARAINDDGFIVGWVTGNSCKLAIEWIPAGAGQYSYRYLAPARMCSTAFDINAHGVVVGTAITAGRSAYAAVQFAAGSSPVILVGQLYNSASYALSNGGRAAGVLDNPSDTAWTRFPITGGNYRLPQAGAARNAALGVNSCGQIVGALYAQFTGFPQTLTFADSRAVLWDNQRSDCHF